MKIGLIGLGIMGKPMGKNPLKAGYDLTASNRNKASAEEMMACGAKGAGNAEIGEACDLMRTMVPNGPQVKEVMPGENGVAAKDMDKLRGRDVGSPYLPSLSTLEGAARQGIVSAVRAAGLLDGEDAG